jgi:hypothetical protein
MTKISRRDSLKILASYSALSSGLISCGGAGEATFASSQSSALNRRLGIGLGGLSYYDGTHAYVDIARHAQLRNTSFGTATVDINGHPAADSIMIVGATSANGSSLLYAAGTYKLSFIGQATIAVSGGGVVANQFFNQGSNTTTADWILSTKTIATVYFLFTNTQATNVSAVNTGIKNIRLYRPGFSTDGTIVFTPEFISAMQKFGFIRGMEFTATNDNPQDIWESRSKPSYFGVKSLNGASFEHLIEIANGVNRDVWINIPVKADDDYITKLAQLFKYGSDGSIPYTGIQADPIYPPLSQDLKVYVEYGNEIWNQLFPSSRAALVLSDTARLNISPYHPINFDGAVTNDQYGAFKRWIAYRSAYISLAFRAVFGDSAMMSVVRPILASQVGNGSAYLSNGLAWAEQYFSAIRATAPPNLAIRAVPELWYGGGGAAYYGSSTAPLDTAPSTLTAYFSGLPTSDFGISVAEDATYLKGYGLKCVAYEGGPGPGGSASGDISGATVSAAYNNDLRIAACMITAQAIWDANGGDELGYYVYSGQARPWSFVNDALPNTVADTKTVKLQAIDAIKAITKTSPVLGMVVPGTIYLRSSVSGAISTEVGDTTWKLGGTVYRIRFLPLTQIIVPFRSAAASTRSLHLTVADSSGGAACTVYVNGATASAINISDDSMATMRVTGSIVINLVEGINVIRIYPRSGEFWIRDVVIV